MNGFAAFNYPARFHLPVTKSLRSYRLDLPIQLFSISFAPLLKQRISNDRHYYHNERALLAIGPIPMLVHFISKEEVDFDFEVMRLVIFEQ